MALFSRKEPDARPARPAGRGSSVENLLPRREGRPRIESFLMRVIATGGIVGIGTALAAILDTQGVDAWIIGLVVAAVSVILAAILWSSRTL